MVLNSRKKPGGFPTLWSGTSNLEKFDFALCNIVDEVSWVVTEFTLLAARPPHVILLRKDWDEVRRPGLEVGSVKDFGGTTWDGEWWPSSPEGPLSIAECGIGRCCWNPSVFGSGLVVMMSAYLIMGFAARPGR